MANANTTQPSKDHWSAQVRLRIYTAIPYLVLTNQPELFGSSIVCTATHPKGTTVPQPATQRPYPRRRVWGWQIYGEFRVFRS